MLEVGNIDDGSRRRFLLGVVGVAGTAALGACSSGSDERRDGDGESESDGTTTSTSNAPPAAAAVLPEPGTPGLVDEAAYQARIDEYLQTAAADPDPANLSAIVAALVAAHRDPDFPWDPSTVTVEALQERWDQIDEWRDTRDFALNYMHWILALADGSSPTTTIDPSVIEAIEQRMVDNRYRYDDPLPDDRVDDQWFWSENHILILLVVEYLAGQRMPERTFTITGLTGAEHMERAKPLILEWVQERARFGFFEWHSHVYMKKNVEPLATLVQHADDPDLVLAAAMGLDLCLLDMAGHCHAGSYTASRGRTYAKDKTSGREGTYDMFKLLFDDSPWGYQGGPDAGANHLAGATRYRPPQVLVDIAQGDAPGVTRERHGIFVDGTAPLTENPDAPFGYDFDDPDNLEFWWSQGAVGVWQLAEVGLAEAERFRIFETEAMAAVAALVAINDGDPARVREWVRQNHDVVNFGHLREANTYAWRGDTVAMAAVLDHRFGQMRDQIHAWQATIDPEAYIFTTHPATDLPEGADWTGDAKPGYWTGEASIPRSAQYERTGIHIYQPAWDQANTDPLLWSVFGYEDYTHAFVPQDRFDEVVRDGGWTFARKGDGFLALWSWREPEWRDYDPSIHPTDGMEQPFDLVAAGGPDNVWIVEIGDTGTQPDFAAFMDAVRANEPDVTRDDTGFTVTWSSPTAGEVGFGSTGPFTIDGVEQPLGDLPRHESQWGTVEHLATTYALRSDAAALTLDFEAATRTVDGG
jgi:hypothetical protein